MNRYERTQNGLKVEYCCAGITSATLLSNLLFWLGYDGQVEVKMASPATILIGGIGVKSTSLSTI